MDLTFPTPQRFAKITFDVDSLLFSQIRVIFDFPTLCRKNHPGHPEKNIK